MISQTDQKQNMLRKLLPAPALAGLAGLVLCAASGSASAAGAEITPLGNQLEPVDEGAAQKKLQGDLSLVNETSRTPSGILYPQPMETVDGKPLGDSGWTRIIRLEFGFLANFGETGTASFREYGDFSEDPILNRFLIGLEKPGTALFVNARGGAVGRDDQYYSLDFGRHGTYRVSAFFNSTPHVFATNARVLWEGAGTGSLTLPAGLTPGASSLADVQAAFSSIGESKIALKRDKTGVSLSFFPRKHVEVLAKVAAEWRDGSRPFGTGFNYPGGGQVLESIEPINYQTYDVSTELRYTRERFQAVLSYSGSFFSNDIDSLVVENPGLSTVAISFVPERGEMALSPDNAYHSFRGDFAARLPALNGRFTLTANYTIARQNEKLLAPTVASGIAGSLSRPIDLSQWNTVNALSRDSAEARINTFLVHSRLTLQLSSRLRFTGEFRYQDQDNKTDYTALNPLTGEYGYIALDGGLAEFFPRRSAVFDPSLPGSRVQFRNTPYETDKLLIKVSLDRRLGKRTRVHVGFERKEEDRPFRERTSLNDNKLRLRISTSKSWATLRASYTYGSRSGSEYNPNPYEPFFTSSLPGFTPLLPEGNPPVAIDELRKFDLASRNQHLFDGKINFIIDSKTDLLVSGRYRVDDFSAEFGLDTSRASNLNLEINREVSRKANLYAYYNRQSAYRRVAASNDAGNVSTDGSAGGPVYPSDFFWAETVAEDNHTVGGGFLTSIGDVEFDASYSFTYSRSRVRYSFNSPAAFLGIALAEAGDGFPDQIFRRHLFQSNLKWHVRPGLALRLLYRLESENIDDFHYLGLDDPVIESNVFLAAGPESFTAHVLGIFVDFRF